MMHSVPIITLLIDWNLNRLLAEGRHWAVGMSAASLYALFLILYTKITGEAIYDVVSLKTLQSWGFLVAVFILDAILIVAFHYYGELKFAIWDV